MPRFTVYVSSDCIGGEQSRRLARNLVEISGQVDVVEVVDISEFPGGLPEDLFAVPSWYVDGDLFSLGNPTEDQLRERIFSDG